MLSKDIGIDLGSKNTLIYIKDNGIVLNEPSLIAIKKDEDKIVAVGKEVEEMIGKNPQNIKIIKPIKNGIITNIELTEIMMEEFIKKINLKRNFIKPRLLMGYPSNITDLEKEALKELSEKIGTKELYIEDEGKLAALGAGIKIEENAGNMIVDLGGGITNITVLSLNNIVISKTITIAGDEFNENIIKFIREKYKVLIGEKTAETIKREFSNCYNPSTKKKYKVKGKDLIKGTPTIIGITEKDIDNALSESINKIIIEIKNILEKLQPELSSDIADKGIIITGGSSLLNGLQDKMKEKLNMPVLIAQSPKTSVIEGIEELLKDVKKLNTIV